MPTGVVEHQRLAVTIVGVGVDAAFGLLGGRGVKVLALHVVLVDVVGQLTRDSGVVGKHQTHAVESTADAAGGIDTGSDKEHQIADGEFFLKVTVLGFLGGFGAVGGIGQVGLATVDMAVLENGFDAGTRLGVEHAQAEEGQHSVLAHDGDNVAGDGHCHQIEVLQQAQFQVFLPFLTIGVELLGQVAQAHAEPLLEVGFDDFEAYAAAAKFLVGVRAVDLLGVEHGHSLRHHVTWEVMVADDKVDAEFSGIVDLLHGFDATVEGDDKFHPRLACIVNALIGDAIPFPFAVGDVEIDIVVQLFEVRVD